MFVSIRSRGRVVRRRAGTLLLVAQLLSLLSACDDERGHATAERGSSGTQSFIVETTPLVDVEGTSVGGDFVLGYPSGAARLSTGTVVVADGIGSSVLFFDGSGRPSRAVGREGTGPGEFQRIVWLGQCGFDSVYAWDDMQRRMTVIDRDGNVVRQYRLPSDPGKAISPAIIRCSRSGRFAVLARPRDLRPPTPDGDSPHYSADLVIANRVGMVTSVIGEFPVGQSRPLGKVTVLAISDDQFYVGTNDSAYIDVYAIDGTYANSIPIGVTRRVPGRIHYEHVVDAQVQWLSDADQRQAMREVLLNIPMPELLPAYAGIFLDGEDRLWVQVSIPGDGETRLRGFSTDGSTIGELRIPIDLRIFEVGIDYVLGGFDGDLGEPHVVAYRFSQMLN